MVLRPRRSEGSALSVRPERSGGSVLAPLPERAVQFGTGAFLRGFVDDFLQRANEQGTFNGRVVAIGSTGSHRDQALREQDGLYTLVVRGVEHGAIVDERRVVSSLSRALSAATEWSEVLEVARSPELELVFSNTTEVGIALDERDTLEAAPPVSFPAKLARFLFERAKTFEFSGHGLIVIPCELIEDNGARLREFVTSVARRWELGSPFLGWLEREVTFCNTLVDRIVPGAPKGAEAELLASELGYEDALLTCAEPYRLFAIEGDERLRERLPWTAVDDGIVVAPDIAPFRARKLYLLNGAHTLMAPVALRRGHETVAEAMADPDIQAFVRRAMFDEIVPVLGVDGAAEFAEAVLDRFSNPFIQHALADITLHATMKMRVRVVPSIERYYARFGEAPQALVRGFAAHLVHVRDCAPAARRPDSQAGEIAEAWSRHQNDAQVVVKQVAANAALWGTDLNRLPGFVNAVTSAVRSMETHA